MRKTIPYLTLLVIVLSIFALPSPLPVSHAVQVNPAASCNEVLEKAVEQLTGKCSNLERDQVCYGNYKIDVEYQFEDSTITFAEPGDLVQIRNLKTISTAPLNLDNTEWGLAVLKLQAKVPGTVAGQAVTFVLYGDTKLTPEIAPYGDSQSDMLPDNLATDDTTASAAPTEELEATDAADQPPSVLESVEAFYLTTGVASQAQCADVPPGGMLVQNPKGEKLHFRVNGVDIDIQSTIILRAQTNEAMAMSVLEGQGKVAVNGEERIVNAGQGIRILLGGASGLEPLPGPLSTPRAMPVQELQIPAVCQVGEAAGLNVPCDVPPVTSTPEPSPSSTPNS